jgi:hypothetical protein
MKNTVTDDSFINGNGIELHYLLSRFDNMKSSEPRDQIYALLSLVPRGGRGITSIPGPSELWCAIQPNYREPIVKVYKSVVYYFSKCGAKADWWAYEFPYLKQSIRKRLQIDTEDLREELDEVERKYGLRW